MWVEKSIIVYDEFETLKKSTHCSIVQYFTIRGVKKRAIMLLTPFNIRRLTP